jgi:hypothetical protein
VIGGAVGSYRTSGFKDWFAAGLNSIAYSNDVYTVTSTANGFVLTSGDGKISKAVTLGVRANFFSASITLANDVTTLYQRHGLSPHLGNLLFKGQTHLGPLTSGGGVVSLVNHAPDAVVRAYVRTIGGATFVDAAVDDHASLTFDTLNMRNQAQTQQVEFALTNGATFEFGFETGPTLSESTDGDSLPDVWENLNGLSSSDPNGINGDLGNPEKDRFNNLEEFILGLSPLASDHYQAGIVKTLSGAQLTFTTIPDRWYRVFYSDDLVTWFPLTSDILGTGSSQTINDTTPETERFYHVKVRLLAP